MRLPLHTGVTVMHHADFPISAVPREIGLNVLHTVFEFTGGLRTASSLFFLPDTWQLLPKWGWDVRPQEAWRARLSDSKVSLSFKVWRNCFP